jgi:hypothetical protein
MFALNLHPYLKIEEFMYRFHNCFRSARVPGAPAVRHDRLTPRLEILEDRCVPSFVPVTYPTGDGSQAWSLAAGDLTGSGIPDLVVTQANYTAGVYLGNGDGTFQFVGNSITGDDSLGVQIADLTGNGIPDIVTANALGGSVSVLLGNGDGTFQPKRDYLTGGTGPGPGALVVADLTGNGIPDIATANFYDNTVSVLLGNADGTFQPAATYAVGAGPVSIAAGFFGTDSNVPDLAVVNSPSGTVSVLVNHGDGTFRQHVDYAVGAAPFGIALGDFANTGTQDIAVANFQSNTVSLLFGNGDHTFQRATNIAVAGGPDRLVAGDFNNDGNVDLAVTVAFGNNNAVRVLLGNGTGQFAPPLTFPTGGDPAAIVAADLTNDGYTDLVTANITGHSYTVLMNDGAWGTPPQDPSTFASTVGQVSPEQPLRSLLPLSGNPARHPAAVGDADGQDQAVVDSGSNTTGTDGLPNLTARDLGARMPAEYRFRPGGGGTRIVVASNSALPSDRAEVIDGLLRQGEPTFLFQWLLGR